VISNPHSHIRRSPQTRPTFAGLRRYNRRTLATHVVVQDAEGWEIPLESIDISPTGIFVTSDFLFEVGDEHTLIFELEGRGMFRVRARVARVEEPADDQLVASAETRPGMGYEFVDTEEDAWQEICAVVAGVGAP
jgi:hypothetical protein